MKYMTLDQRGAVQAEYIWIDAVGGTRSKTKVRCHLPFRSPLSRVGCLIVASIIPVHGEFLCTRAALIRIT